jgi:acetyltransferase-like isoleucine patch superfamily enzyme
MFIIIILVILVMFYFIDSLTTRTYCKIQQKKDEKYGSLTSEKPQYTHEQVRSYCFPKKQIKAFFHLYKGWIRYKLYRLGRFPSHAYRNFMLRNVYLMKIAKTAVLYGGFEVRSPWKIEIGEGSVIGDESKLDGRNGLIIGKNVNFSTGVWVWTEQHDLNDSYFRSNDKGGPVVIDDRAWISSRTMLLPSVHIGEGAIVAASAVVTKDCEFFCIYGGVPARKIGERSKDLKYTFDGTHEAFW